MGSTGTDGRPGAHPVTHGPMSRAAPKNRLDTFMACLLLSIGLPPLPGGAPRLRQVDRPDPEGGDGFGPNGAHGTTRATTQ